MRFLLVTFALIGAALLARGFYALFLLESANEIGLETMTAIEIGFGALTAASGLGIVALLDVIESRSGPRKARPAKAAPSEAAPSPADSTTSPAP